MHFWDYLALLFFLAGGCCLSAIHLRKNGIWGIPTIEQLSSKERKVDLKLVLAAIILWTLGTILGLILKYGRQ